MDEDNDGDDDRNANFHIFQHHKNCERGFVLTFQTKIGKPGLCSARTASATVSQTQTPSVRRSTATHLGHA
jgi:hypothetical protein